MAKRNVARMSASLGIAHEQHEWTEKARFSLAAKLDITNEKLAETEEKLRERRREVHTLLKAMGELQERVEKMEKVREETGDLMK